MEITQAPIVTPPATTPVVKQEKTTDDIIKQISAIKTEVREEPVVPPVNLDEIKDPVARAFLEKRIKELESGVY